MNVALFPPSSGKEENDCPLYLHQIWRESKKLKVKFNSI